MSALTTGPETGESTLVGPLVNSASMIAVVTPPPSGSSKPPSDLPDTEGLELAAFAGAPKAAGREDIRDRAAPRVILGDRSWGQAELFGRAHAAKVAVTALARAEESHQDRVKRKGRLRRLRLNACHQSYGQNVATIVPMPALIGFVA
jgi:hypothetical protein